ncbi:TetR/AcrR family transcriptional regulator C-terminal domain-containing protein [Kitasatospora sp. NPDC048296]|uniref:TetR/AcrR family transcriptional regulator C-terminal domain-containing protein n=1 Tax=Kitasatospora sp. NPDC048296 TaxID=3364048 RepID=UPI003723FE39
MAEAGRFPEVAADYYRRAPERTIAALAACFQHLAARGLLRLDDPVLAAGHFAWLVLATPMDRAMFFGHDDNQTPAGLERLADEGVRVFLAAYSARWAVGRRGLRGTGSELGTKGCGGTGRQPHHPSPCRAGQPSGTYLIVGATGHSADRRERFSDAYRRLGSPEVTPGRSAEVRASDLDTPEPCLPCRRSSTPERWTS